MLFLIGTGLSYNDISLSAINICKDCEVYIEKYTSYVSDEKIEFLERQIGKSISVLSRSDLEENIKNIVGSAKAKKIAILVGGDPLTATTHKILFTEAAKQNVNTKVCHSSSIIPASIGESGLDFYRFGQTCTISKWSDKYKPISFYETIERNARNNLHTIVLLDYDAKQEKSLDIKEALEILESAEAHYKMSIIKETTKIFVMHNMSLDDEAKYFTDVKSAKRLSFGKGMSLIIIPAKIIDIEKESIESLYGV